MTGNADWKVIRLGGHQHNLPPNPERWPHGSEVQCSCGQRFWLDRKFWTGRYYWSDDWSW